MDSMTQRIVRGLWFTILERNFIQASSFVTFFIIVSHLSLKDFGLLQLLFSVIGPGTTIALIGLDRLIVSDIAVLRAQKNEGAIRQLLVEYSVTGSALLGASFVFAWFLKGYLSQFYVTGLAQFYWALVCLVSAQATMNFTSVIFEAYEQFNLSFWTKWCESLVRLSVVASFFLWFSFSLQSILWAYVLAKVVSGLFSVLLLPRVIQKRSTFQKKQHILLSIFKKHGKWEIISSFVLTISDNIGPWFVNFYVSTEAVALLAFTQKVSTACMSLMPIKSVLFPILSHALGESREKAFLLISTVRKYSFLITCCFLLVSISLIRFPILWFTPQYIDSLMLIRLALLHLFVDVFTLGQSIIFYARKAQKRNFFISIFSAALSIVLQIIGVLLFKAAGVIISWLCVGVIVGIVREYTIHKHLDLPHTSLRSLFWYDARDKEILASIIVQIRALFLKTFGAFLGLMGCKSSIR